MLVMASSGESLPQSGTVKHTLHKCASNLQYNTTNVIIRFVLNVIVNNGNGSQNELCSEHGSLRLYNWFGLGDMMRLHNSSNTFVCNYHNQWEVTEFAIFILNTNGKVKRFLIK